MGGAARAARPSTSAAPVLFPTCLVQQLRPALLDTALRVLRRFGHDPVLARGATCCGQPAWNTGLEGAARRVARRTLRALGPSQGPVVVPSGSCATMMREFWPQLFAGTGDAAAAGAVAHRVVELSAFLEPQAGELRRSTSAAEQRVAYHDSCHMLRELGIHSAPRRLLGAADVEVVEVAGAELCCGFGGTFAVKLPEVSTAMADEKLDSVMATGVGTLVGCDLSCLLHLQGRAERRGLHLSSRHLVEVLDDA
ncbi:MAG: (Fe-S)-binding protein [Candidatus Dormibacteria bacterium]